MDLAQLESFVALGRHGSFTRAAEELHLTQPAVSRHVQKLERELGRALLARRRGAIALTPAGERFLEYAREAVDRHRRMLSDLGRRAALAGELRIAASTTPGEFLVPGLVASFTARHPDVRPQVFIADSAEVVEELRARRSDVGFVGIELPGRDLRYHVVAGDEVVLAVPAGHPFAERGEVPLEELAGQLFLEREGGSGTLLTFRTALAERGLAPPAYRVAMVLSNTQAIISAVQNGYGIGLVSSLALRVRETERVAAVRLAGLPLRRSLFLVLEKGRPLPPAAAGFAAWVRAGAGSPAI